MSEHLNESDIYNIIYFALYVSRVYLNEVLVVY